MPDNAITKQYLDLEDSNIANILPILPEAVEFIDQALTNNGKVLVHCIAGVSRSASCVIAYLMAKNKMNYENAYFFVQ